MLLDDLDLTGISEIHSRAAEPIRDVKQYSQIVDLLKDHPRNQTLFLLGTTTNLRGGDLLNLKIQNALDLETKGYCVIKEGKTDKLREVFLNKIVRPVFVHYLRERLLKGAQPKDHYFMGRKGPIKRPYFSHLVQAWCAAVGVQGKISGHSLRKTYGFFQLNFNGVSLPALMDDFNHSSLEMTLKYVGVTDRSERRQRVVDFFQFMPENDRQALSMYGE